MQDNQVTNLDVVSFNVANKAALKVELLIRRHINLCVLCVTSQIIIELLDHRDRKHDNERHHKRDEETDAQRGDDLREGDQQEEEIEEVLELVEEHFGDETVPSVLAIIDGVAHIPILSIHLTIQVYVSQL